MLLSIGEHVKSVRIGPYHPRMDAATADALLVAAREARAAMRSGDDAAVARMQELDPDLGDGGGEERMSEAGWKAFLGADDVDDWAVLHGGATAAYRVGSMGEALRLAEAIAAVPGLEAAGPVLTISASRLTVRLTRDMWQLETHHVELARAVSAVAMANGATPDRVSIQEVQLAIAAKPDAIDKPFWAAVLGYVPLADDNVVDPLAHGSTVWMQELDAARPLRHAMHVDVSVAREHARARLDAAIAAGGRIVTESNEHWTLSDRAGNRVCIAVWPDGGTTSDPAA
jgi:4a-hydroxytetrahydrobiopterin dehydratase